MRHESIADSPRRWRYTQENTGLTMKPARAPRIVHQPVGLELRTRRTARRRRHGRGVPRDRQTARPFRSLEVPVLRGSRRSGRTRALHPRSTRRIRSGPPQRWHHLRYRRRHRRRAVHRHGVPRRRDGRRSGASGTGGACGRSSYRRCCRGRVGRCACTRDRASRHQAVEHHDHPRRRGQDR